MIWLDMSRKCFSKKFHIFEESHRPNIERWKLNDISRTLLTGISIEEVLHLGRYLLTLQSFGSISNILVFIIFFFATSKILLFG